MAAAPPVAPCSKRTVRRSRRSSLNVPRHHHPTLKNDHAKDRKPRRLPRHHHRNVEKRRNERRRRKRVESDATIEHKPYRIAIVRRRFRIIRRRKRVEKGGKEVEDRRRRRVSRREVRARVDPVDPGPGRVDRIVRIPPPQNCHLATVKKRQSRRKSVPTRRLHPEKSPRKKPSPQSIRHFFNDLRALLLLRRVLFHQQVQYPVVR